MPHLVLEAREVLKVEGVEACETVSQAVLDPWVTIAVPACAFPHVAPFLLPITRAYLGFF